jgi:hypothetical protein
MGVTVSATTSPQIAGEQKGDEDRLTQHDEAVEHGQKHEAGDDHRGVCVKARVEEPCHGYEHG